MCRSFQRLHLDNQPSKPLPTLPRPSFPRRWSRPWWSTRCAPRRRWCPWVSRPPPRLHQPLESCCRKRPGLRALYGPHLLTFPCPCPMHPSPICPQTTPSRARHAPCCLFALSCTAPACLERSLPLSLSNPTQSPAATTSHPTPNPAATNVNSPTCCYPNPPPQAIYAYVTLMEGIEYPPDESLRQELIAQVWGG